MIRCVILGSAAGGGFPQWNCNCANCQRARLGDPAAKPRTQSSVAISADDRTWFLLNASPDLRHQIGETGVLHPVGEARHSPIAGVVLTNADVDHVAGLLTLRERQPLTVYATNRVQEVLRNNTVFNVLANDVVNRRAIELGVPLDLPRHDGQPSGISIELFAVPGKVALYLEDPSAGAGLGTVAEDAVGVAITHQASGQVAHYIPGCAALPPELATRIDGSSLVLFDGTTWTDEEMVSSGLGKKTGRRMGHMSISGSEGSLAAFAGLNIGRKIFVHINNSNPVLLDDSPERTAVEQAGWEVAEDGMDIRL